MVRSRAPLTRQLGWCLDRPEKHEPSEEIREAIIQTLTDLLCEAHGEMPTGEHPQEEAQNEPEADA